MFRSWIRRPLANGDEKRATKLERGAPLFIFLKRDHGALLQVTGRPREALQYEIGYPHTASKNDPASFTRRPLCAAARHTLRRRNAWVDFRIRQTAPTNEPWR